MRRLVTMGILALSACATTTDVMDTGNGTYMISARAPPVMGGATGAQQVAYTDAMRFCASRRTGARAVVIGANSRDLYQSAFGGSTGTTGRGAFAGGASAAGSATLRFRCEP